MGVNRGGCYASRYRPLCKPSIHDAALLTKVVRVQKNNRDAIGSSGTTEPLERQSIDMTSESIMYKMAEGGIAGVLVSSAYKAVSVGR